ncbi:MAG: 2-octaprenyl-6-methoxyphenyl hydroxylase [Rhodobacteraceae bacterium]|nr:2-octaprenyl-6-methoxyphenyl hydroxylase [Paracoccaceae bacterium]
MIREHFDIFISGGGIAGLIATCAFAAKGFSVLCVDPNQPVTTSANPKADRRSTAFLQPARRTLKAAGMWSRLARHGEALQIMRLADAGGNQNEIRYVADFNANDVSDLPFGWNFPNWLLRRELLAQIQTLTRATFRQGIGTKRLLTRNAQALVTLTDDAVISANLIIAADGRDSPIREMVGIGAKTWRYGQKGIVFTVSHETPHENISTEIHRTGGPFTLVPLPDNERLPQSAVVWMEAGAEAARLMDLPDIEFANEATARSCGVVGSLTLTSRRAIWPIISQKADRLTAERTALIAEAAHVLPPIGAQGLNMSLIDIQTLINLSDFHELGSEQMLTAYDRARNKDVLVRLHGIDLLNRASLAADPNLQAIRLKGLQFLHSSITSRKLAMRAGLGG